MKRQVTIYESALNGKVTVLNDVDVTTLGDVKRLLDEKGINYQDMDFIEGVTNTKLLGDDSRLPENIPFKGKYTDNIFINILKKESKIKSGGMTRSELLAAAKPYKDEIEKKFNANYTRVKSADIEAFLQTKKAGQSIATQPAEAPAEKENPEVDSPEGDKITRLEKAILYLAEDANLLSEVQEILNPVPPKPKEVKSFFEDDMNSLIRKG